MRKIVVKLFLSVVIPFALFGIFSFVCGYTEWMQAKEGIYQVARGFYVILCFVLITFLWGGEYL